MDDLGRAGSTIALGYLNRRQNCFRDLLGRPHDSWADGVHLEDDTGKIIAFTWCGFLSLNTIASATWLGGRVLSSASSALMSTSRRSSGGSVATKEALSMSAARDGSAGATLGASRMRRLRASCYEKVQGREDAWV